MCCGDNMDKNQEIERSIIKKYRKSIWRMFTKALNEYDLIQENDKIAVCISGGKDSFLAAKCLQELRRHGKINFELEFIVMDPGYNKHDLKKLKENAKTLNIPIDIFKSDIFEVVTSLEEGEPCYLCARMRRGYLYNRARELGCNKIALGHHYDDVIETILMSMLYGGEVKTMMPKLYSANYEDMQLIRPLYLIKEADIILWAKSNDLEFMKCGCPFLEACALDDSGGSKRAEMKQLVNQFRETSKHIEQNIFKSVENINLDAVIGYKKSNKKTHFLDEYEKR